MKQANLLPSLAMALLLYPATQAVAQSGSYPGGTSQSSQPASHPTSTQSSQDPMQSSQQNPSQQSSANSSGPNDADIQNKLTHTLSNDRFKNVHATVNNGVVNLQGTVDMYSAKDQAERKAAGIDHVQGVRDQIEVVGKQVPDDQLREKLAEKLRYDRLGYGYGNVFNALGLNVQNGIVTLEGKVRDETDHAYAVSLVENTPGVKGVHDEIQVEPASIRDDELRIQLARHIYGDPVLQKYAMDPQAPIRIVVDHGNVALYGVVNNQMDKTVALMRAREVPGTFKVEDHLMVAGGDQAKEKNNSSK
jgi:hyperosmotically inducible protein